MPECEALCGSEELLATLNDFKRAVELLAAVAYNLARALGRDDAARAIRDAVERYVAADPGLRLRAGECYAHCEPGDEYCWDRCNHEERELIEDAANAILGEERG